MTWFGHKRRHRAQSVGNGPVHGSSSNTHIRGSSHPVYAVPVAATTTHSLVKPLQSSSYQSSAVSSVHLAAPAPPSPPPRPLAKWTSHANLSGMLLHPVDTASTAVAELEDQIREWWASGVDVYGLFMRKLDDTITAMDEGLFTEKDRVDMGESQHIK